VTGVPHEPAPELQRLLSLPRHQTRVLQPGDNATPVGRKAGELRDSQWPDRAPANKEPTLPVGTKLDWPPTRHCPFESRTCAESLHALTAARNRHPHAQPHKAAYVS
jgi:hypothetical protein